MSETSPVDEFLSSKLTGYTPPLATLANAVMVAYNAYIYNSPLKITNYTTVAPIYALETISDEPGYQLFGFAATNGACNIVALRGTVTTEEAWWVNTAWGDPVPFYLNDSFGNSEQYGNVESGLISFYQGADVFFTSLADSLKAAVTQLDSSLPLFVVAHSLGGAVATLGALDIVVSGSYPNPPMPPAVVTFGSLHVGDQSFVDAYNPLLPVTLRIANLSDFVPSLVGLTPASGNPPPPTPYVHVGIPVCFVWQKWDDWANHSMQYTYQASVNQYPNVLTLGNPADAPYKAPWYWSGPGQTTT